MKSHGVKQGRKRKHIHFVGIKGIAMAALAVWAKEAGYRVTGSDTNEEFPSDEVLEKAHIFYDTSFEKTRIISLQPDLVIYTGAHNGRENREVVEALSLRIPIMSHGEALGEFMKGKRQISVAGSHGKTTTTAMIATIFSEAGLDPSYAIGCGMIRGLGLPGHYGKGQVFISEADEYVTDPGHDDTPRFLWQSPELFVVTNIDYDHPDVYKDLASVQKAFESVQERNTRSTSICNYDDTPSHVLFRADRQVVTYGSSPLSNMRITHIGIGTDRTFFSLELNSMSLGEFELRVPGKHNVHNAAAASLACYEFGLSWEIIRKGLQVFGGTKRRCEKLAQGHGISLYDDYAHHPKEILATLDALRSWYPNRRIITIFQPHTYSRTGALLKDFSRSFGNSGVVFVTDIYASAREKVQKNITSKQLADMIRTQQKNVFYAPNLHSVQSHLIPMMQSGDIIVLMGAGNIYTWGKELQTLIA